MHKRHASKAIHLSSLVLLFFVVALGLVYSSKPSQTVAQGGASQLSGYAWSSNIGWIEFGGDHDNPVVLDPIGSSHTNLNGYAWSSNVGWIKFGVGLSGPGGPEGQPPHGSRIEADGTVTGWARACSVFAADTGCPGALRGAEQNGGWDGWIKMSGSWDNGVEKVGNALTGYAWGSEVLGWIDFSRVTIGGAPLTARCEVRNIDASGSVVNGPIPAPARVYWAAVPQGGSGSYEYCWGNGCGLLAPWGTITGSTQHVPPGGSFITYNNPTTVNAKVRVTDTVTDSTADSSLCSLEVYDPSIEHNLNLDVTAESGANGSVESNPGNIECSVGDVGVCADTFSHNVMVTLTADPVGESEVEWTVDGLPRCVNSLTCDIVMSDDKSVSVRFIADDEPTGGGDTTVVLQGPETIRISQQSDGIPTSSVPDAIYDISSPGGDPSEVCVASVKSISNPTYQINPSLSRCYLWDGTGSPTPGECGGTNRACVDLRSNGEATFVVTVEDLSWEILTNSPYQVILETDGSTVPDNDTQLEFRYQPPNVEPE